MKTSETSQESRFSIFVCGVKRAVCSSHNCERFAIRACDFAVTREGVPTTCGRPVCEKCVVPFGGKLHCAAHGRVVTTKGGK